jgi:hypothetical protein
MSTLQKPQSEKWLEAMARKREITSYVLLGLGVAICVALLILGFRFRSQIAAELLVFALVAPVFIGCGVYALLRKEGSSSLSNLDAMRLIVLIIGAAVGFAVFVEFFIRAIIWWSWMTGGLDKWQESGAWRVWLVLFGAPTGLAIMFATVLLARTEEQSNPFMRRVLYGYNAIVSCLLVLMILAVINILAYLYIPKTSDWTASGLYTLSSEGQNTIKNLEKPVKIIHLTEGRDYAYNDVKILLENCRTLNPDKVSTEEILRNQQPSRVAELGRRYKLANNLGLLVISGTDANEEYQFVPESDLIERPPPRMRRDEPESEPKFKGEDALISTIRFLDEGKKEPVIYFTQGNGELDILGGAAAQDPDQSASILRGRLEKGNYKVKGLKLGGISKDKGDGQRVVVAKEVPSDAVVVVVAGPKTALSIDAVNALREYMNPKDPKKPKGKMIVLLDVDIDPLTGNMVKSGLEGLLAEYNIEVTNERILAANLSDPDTLLVVADPRLADRNPVAAAFHRERIRLPMKGVRSIKQRMADRPRGGGNYQTDILLVTDLIPVFPESRTGDAKKILQDLRDNHQDTLAEKLTERMPVALAVSESDMPADAFHAGMGGMGDQKPRMVVFGDATWASDVGMSLGQGMRQQQIGEALNQVTYALMASSIAWLRERPGAIGIPAKSRDTYAISNDINGARLLLWPTTFMLVGIFGVGIGVWAVRRR